MQPLAPHERALTDYPDALALEREHPNGIHPYDAFDLVERIREAEKAREDADEEYIQIKQKADELQEEVDRLAGIGAAEVDRELIQKAEDNAREILRKATYALEQRDRWIANALTQARDMAQELENIRAEKEGRKPKKLRAAPHPFPSK